MRRKSGLSAKEARARDCVIRTAIGRMLSAQYDVAARLPDRLETLLKRLENIDEISAVDTHRTQISRAIGSRSAAFPTGSQATTARSPSIGGSK